MGLVERVRAFELTEIQSALIACRWHQTNAARLLGIPRTTLLSKMSDYQLAMPWDADDPPLAWAIRWDGSRFDCGACWTKDELSADVENPATHALLLERGDAILRVKEMNTIVATRAAYQERIAV